MMWWNPWRVAREAQHTIEGLRMWNAQFSQTISTQKETINKLQRTVLEQHKLLSRAVFRDPKTGRMVKAKK